VSLNTKGTSQLRVSRTCFKRKILLTLGVLPLVAWALWFRPEFLGGRVDYILVGGRSMLPTLHGGDLVVVQREPAYRVGDVVAYRSEGLDTTVMHRIVQRDGDRFVTQGDNNDFLDEDHPTTDDVMGTLWFRVPHGGKALAALTSPAVLGVVSVAVGALMWAVRRPRRRGRGRADGGVLPACAGPMKNAEPGNDQGAAAGQHPLPRWP